MIFKTHALSNFPRHSQSKQIQKHQRAERSSYKIVWGLRQLFWRYATLSTYDMVVNSHLLLTRNPSYLTRIRLLSPGYSALSAPPRDLPLFRDSLRDELAHLGIERSEGVNLAGRADKRISRVEILVAAGTPEPAAGIDDQ